MAAAYVQIAAQQEDQDNSGTAWVMTVDANTTSGNRLLLLIQQEDALVTAVSDSKSNTWTKVLDLTTGAGMFPNAWTCQLASALTTSDTITATKNVSTDRPTSATCVEISGADTSAGTGSIRVTATSSGATGNNPSSTGTTATNGSTDDFAMAIWTVNDAATYDTYTNSFTERADFGTLSGTNGFVHHAVATKTLSATATVECTATRTGGSGLAWSSAIVVVKSAGGGSSDGTVDMTGVRMTATATMPSSGASMSSTVVAVPIQAAASFPVPAVSGGGPVDATVDMSSVRMVSTATMPVPAVSAGATVAGTPLVAHASLRVPGVTGIAVSVAHLTLLGA